MDATLTQPATTSQVMHPSPLTLWPAIEGWDALLIAGLLETRRDQHASNAPLLIGNSRDRCDAAALGCDHVSLIDSCSGRRSELARRIRQITTVTSAPLTMVTMQGIMALEGLSAGAHTQLLALETLKLALQTPQPADARATHRATLGLSDDELCLLLLTGKPGIGDARSFTGLVGVMELDDHLATGIASDRCGRANRASRFTTAFRRWDTLLIDTPPVAHLAAADLVLIDRGEDRKVLGESLDASGHLSALRAMLIGTPVIMVASNQTAAWLGDSSSIGARLISKDATLPELAKVIVPMLRSSDLRAEIAAWCKARGQQLLDPCGSSGGVLRGW
jgi:hypothetical protein